jgi:hypothetical protein
MRSSCLALLLLPALASGQAAPQPSSDAPQKNIMVIGELTHAIDVKKAKVGDQITLRLVHNVGSNGRIVVPYKKGTVIGHISQVQPPSRENPESMVAIEFDRIQVKGGSDLPITATIRSMIPPDHRMIRHSTGIPTSGDDPVSRAAGPMVDANNRPVSPPPAPLTQPGPRAAASEGTFSGMDGVEVAPNSATHSTVITSSKKSLWIEADTRITLAANSPAL